MNEIILTSELIVLETIRQADKIKVEFIKKDNSKRLMDCTLNFNLIPEKDFPKKEIKKEDTEEIAKTKKLIHVYDLEKKGWRSLSIDRINWMDIDGQVYKVDLNKKSHN